MKVKNTTEKKVSAKQRRKEIIQYILSIGDPRLVNQTDLAHKYRVSRVQITKDMKLIKERIRGFNEEDMRFMSHIVYGKALSALMAKEDWLKAVKVLESYNKWLGINGQTENVEDPVFKRIQEYYEEAKRKNSDKGGRENNQENSF